MASKKKTLKKDWSCYLLICSDGSYYCGITNNMAKRLEDHNRGKGAKYTRGRLPVRITAIRQNMTKSGAATFESMVKKQKKEKKVTFFKTFGRA
jgi:putative endonuclease